MVLVDNLFQDPDILEQAFLRSNPRSVILLFNSCCFSHSSSDFIFLGLSFIYTVDIGVRFIGLGWASFRANGWNIFDVIVVTGSIATTIPILSGSTGFVIQQLQKLFLVSIAFKLVQRNNSLNQLFKTSV